MRASHLSCQVPRGGMDLPAIGVHARFGLVRDSPSPLIPAEAGGRSFDNFVAGPGAGARRIFLYRDMLVNIRCGTGQLHRV
jgi:hypothetical protein